MIARKHSFEHQVVYDAVIIGGGMVGTCIARDLASLGYHAAILERSEALGGVWNTNDYPGLRLNSPGSCYRCLSLAPSWSREHDASDWYRPGRREILAYIHAMADHPGITVKTGCSYRQHLRAGDLLGIRCDDGSHIFSRALIFSTGFSLTACGPPNLPIDPTLLESRYSQLVFHSSQLDHHRFGQARQAKRKFVLGSGKAAIELLRQFDPQDNIIWVHRGHTAFLDRDYMNQQYASGGMQLDRLFKKAFLKSRKTGNHWTELAVDQGLLVTCGRPLTEQRVKWDGGVVGDADLQHARKFQQMLIESVTTIDGRIRLTPKHDEAFDLREDDCLMMCTGQENPSWCLPAFDEDGVASVVMTSVAAPLCSILPLRLTIDYLEGYRENIEEIRRGMPLIEESPLLSSALEPRELQTGVMMVMQKVLQSVFNDLKADFLYRREWNQDWYGRDLDVTQIFDELSCPRSSDAPITLKPLPHARARAA